jgi:hypothetical protein
MTPLSRRRFLELSAAVCGSACVRVNSTPGDSLFADSARHDELAGRPPAFSVIPVVGDGKWIWTEPPKDQTGYLEPRKFRLRVGIDLQANGDAGDILASTPVPVAVPEQQITAERATADVGRASLDALTPTARQLTLLIPQLPRGARASAVAEFALTASKQYFGYSAEQFPTEQKVPADVRAAALGDSPGIQTQSPLLLKLLSQLKGDRGHPWHWARAFADWVPENIRPQLGSYTSVTTALEKRLGDCEEMAGVFVALCRAAGIPARLVWIPNHVWSEFYLTDHQGVGHWIPAHTACYPWFGWTGVHELVLQKGDRLRLPGKPGLVRLQTDRLRWAGSRPEVRYWAELEPLADEPGGDAGPGARSKSATGEWVVVGKHELDRVARR